MTAVYVPTCDGIVMCADCPFRDTSDCDKYQDNLADVGRGDDYALNFWDLIADEKAAVTKDGLTYASAPAEKRAVIERILSDTQGKRSRPNPIFFVEASELCWLGL